MREKKETAAAAAVAAAVGSGEGEMEEEANTPSSLGVEDTGFVDVEIGLEEEEVEGREGRGRREEGRRVGPSSGGMVMELSVMASGRKVLAQ